MDNIKISTSGKFIIPLIYKDFKRVRGPEISTKEFYNIIHQGIIDNKLPDCISPMIIETEQLKKLYQNKKFRDSILFSFNFVQDIKSRGMYPLIARQDDICFSKGNDENLNSKNEYAQSFKYSKAHKMKYFPKYLLRAKKDKYKILESWDRIIDYKVNISKAKSAEKVTRLKIGVYFRTDTCPLQAKRYNDFIETHSEEKYGIEFIKIGDGHVDMNIFDFLNSIDIILYTEPSHSDPWPNTIFEAVSSNIPVIYLMPDTKVIKPENSGFMEITERFPSSILYLPPEIKTIKHIIRKYRFYKRDIVDFNVDFNFDRGMRLAKLTKESVFDHVLKVYMKRLKKENS